MTIDQAIKELYYWQWSDSANNFHALLFTLISKADMGNRARLQMGFPEEVEAFELWHKSPDAHKFFAEYGLGTGYTG